MINSDWSILEALERWCVGGSTNQNKCSGKSGGDQYIGGPPRFKVGGGDITPCPPLVAAPLVEIQERGGERDGEGYGNLDVGYTMNGQLQAAQLGESQP